MTKLTLKTKLLTLFLIVGLVPLGLIVSIAYSVCGNALKQAADDRLVATRDVAKHRIQKWFDRSEIEMEGLVETAATLREDTLKKLQAVGELKSSELEDYFERTLSEVRAIADSHDGKRAFAMVKEYHDKIHAPALGPLDVDSDDYRQLRRKINEECPFLANYVKEYGYSDVYVICAAHGHVLYSQKSCPDLGANLAAGKLKEEGLARLWRKVLDTDCAVIEDFAAYSPADGNQVAFVGAPIKGKGGKPLAVVALQLPTTRIDEIIGQRAGMGESGESFLVGRCGGKTAYRSDCRAGQGKTGQTVPADSDLDSALDGNDVRRLKPSATGDMEVVVYTPLKIQGLDWCMVSCANALEVFAPRLEGEEKDFYGKFRERTGCYDLLLIDPKGNCFYSVCREADLGTNLVDGKYADSGLGILTREVLRDKCFRFVDFRSYTPSGGEQAAFVARPVLSKDGEVEMIVAMRLATDQINDVMNYRKGMGETGCAYLVTKDHDGDYAFRSDLTFMDDRYTLGYKIKTDYIVDAVESDGDGVGTYTDSHGNGVMVAYSRFDAAGTPWAVVAKINEAEALASMTTLSWITVALGCVSAAVIAFIGWWARTVDRKSNQPHYRQPQRRRRPNDLRRRAGCRGEPVAGTGRLGAGRLTRRSHLQHGTNVLDDRPECGQRGRGQETGRGPL